MGRGVGFWGFPGGLGFAPVRARCGGGAAAWVAGVRAAPGTQGSWWLGHQETQCSRRVWQPVLANMLQYSCLENPLPDREAWQATIYRVARSLTLSMWPCVHRCKTFFCLWQLCFNESLAWRWHSCLACGDPGGTKCSGTWTDSTAGVMALSECFF